MFFNVHRPLVILLLVSALTACQGPSPAGLLGRATPQPAATAVLLPPQENPASTTGANTAVKEVRPPPTPVEAGQTPTLVLVSATASPAIWPTPTATRQADSPRVMALGVRPSLILRSLAEGTAPAVATLPGSQVLWAQARSADSQWLLVTYTRLVGNQEVEAHGWVASRDVTLMGEAESLPALTAGEELAARSVQPAAGAALAAEPGQGVPGRVLANQLNVRGGPGLDQPVLGQLSAGDGVVVVGRSAEGDWLAITWQAQGMAWVAARYVEFSGKLDDLPIAGQATSRVPPPASAPSGKIAFQTSIGGDIYVMNADGSGLRRVASGMDPLFAPDGARLAYARWDTPHGIFVFDLRTGQEQRVASANRPRSPSWSPDGSRLAFSHSTRSYTCLETPVGCYPEQVVRNFFGEYECIDTIQGRYCIGDFPERKVDDTGLAQVTLADGNWQDLASEPTVQSPDWHPRRNEILYRGRFGLQITEPGHDTRRLVENPDLGSPAWSPDGQRMAVQIYLHDHADIFLLDAAGNIQQRLTAPASAAQRAPNSVAPAWSPDGRAILFLSDRDGAWRLYRMNADGSGQALYSPNTLRDITFAYDFAAERVVSWAK